MLMKLQLDQYKRDEKDSYLHDKWKKVAVLFILTYQLDSAKS